MKIDNGKRVRIKLGRFEGPAGMVERLGRWEVAFPGRARDFVREGHVEIDGVRWKIDLCERSDQALHGRGPTGFVRLTISPA